VPNTVWQNTVSVQRGPKSFGITLNMPHASTRQILEVTADALSQMNSGRLWKIRPQRRTPGGPEGWEPPRPDPPQFRTVKVPIQVPEGVPPEVEAVFFEATGDYSTADHSGYLNLTVAAQRHIDGQRIGWNMNFVDRPEDKAAFAGPWQDWISEEIAAQTLLFCSDSFLRAFKYPPNTSDPTRVWTMLEGGWRSSASFIYNGWSITLGGSR
jgi:hypothetical protein